MLSQMVRFPSSLWLNNIPVCVFIFNSFTSGRFSLLPCLGHYQQCCSEHGLQIALWVSVSVVLRQIPRSRTVRLYGRSIFNFLRKFHSVFYSGCTTLHTPPIIRRGTFLPTLAICCLSENSHSDVISLWLWLNFPDDQWRWAFLSWICWPFACLLWENVCSDLLPIFILDCLFFAIKLYEFFIYRHLSHIWSGNTVRHSAGCLFISLTVSLLGRGVLVW